jgi:hypothetical protein
VAFEAILVSALLLAHLAVPSQLLQSLCFNAIGDLQQKSRINYCPLSRYSKVSLSQRSTKSVQEKLKQKFGFILNR